MFGKIKPENLAYYLQRVEKYFPEFKDKKRIDKTDIERYYNDSFWGYALFHSWAGAIHMALSKDGVFRKNDYFRQAEEVSKEIQISNNQEAFSVLEVGCGRGFNIRFLARRLPNVKFHGVDITKRNILAARKDAQNVLNVEFSIGDFHELSEISDSSQDYVFAVETLCHSDDIEKAAKSISRVLTTGGKLIVFDGFRGLGEQLSAIDAKAVKYAERSMAVPSFHDQQKFFEAFEKCGLRLELREDRSDDIMPNLIRLSDLAKAFFKFSFFSRIFLYVLPRGLVANSIAGILMAITVQSGSHKYIKCVFVKE